ncbi:hypothetical protein VE01_00251 [Pseudogymnoascus verrucosus]|uniref:Zn(2)-C6 fungal-type domain-containing protein n=1 Tax=Pseudogymnoascus verrucosus TaxID=342668 RepID=A0A2P2SX28_9PEZI|nr:uncharacterized protein VE01_00251 [Pseudogymnoascus verrucosus]OBU01354.2 hypothetical protein VE01_00251 [Pseudogymnoascus verrucosus]
MHRYTALDSPLLRVSRPVAACSRCRAAKIKCDGKLPACTACEKAGRVNECSSSNDQFAKGKERSYVASLESRVEKLEKRIAYAKMRKASVTMHEGDSPPMTPPDRKDSLAAIRAAIQGKAARRREATDVNELVSDFGFMTVNATMRDFDTKTTSLTFARLILAASLNEPLPRLKNPQMPSRQTAMGLLQYYLENVLSLFPAFPETALFNALDAVYQENPQHVEDFDYWILYMVLAIGSMCQSRSSTDTFYKDGVDFVVRALKFADHVLMPGYPQQIQALILLVQYSTLDPAHFDSWQLIGFTCRAAVDLGYHQDPPKEQAVDKRALQQRRKIFYSAYALDRSISMVHARPFSFTDDAITVAFPADLSSTSDPESPISKLPALDASLLIFQLRKAQSTWYQELFQSSRDPLHPSSQYLWQMCYEMRTWSENLPKHLPQATRELFDLELLYSYVYCLAPSCRFPSVSELGKTLIFEYCISYIQKLLPIAKDPINTAFYTYHDALRVYFIGSQFIAVLSDNLNALLQGIIPFVNTIQGGPPPPPIPNMGRTDNISRSIICIEQIIEALKTYGERWDDSKALKSSFEAQSTGMLGELYRRQEEQQQQQQYHQDIRDSSSPGTVVSGTDYKSSPPSQSLSQLGDGWSIDRFTEDIYKG